MYQKRKTISLIEHSVFVLIWLFIFIGTLLIQYYNNEVSWTRVFTNWFRLSPFLILSLLNHFVLVPLVWFKNKKVSYSLILLAVFVVFNVSMFFFSKLSKLNTNVPLVEQQRRMGPPRQRPLPPGFRPNHRERPGSPMLPPRMQRPGFGGLPPMANTALVTLLVLGFGTGLRTVFKWTRAEHEKNILEKDRVKTELAFLRNQVNPHFLMNTLNNIHGLVDIDTEMAKETVIKLSKLMRYLLYDTEREFIPIKEEVTFIKSYVELMKMRVTDRVTVRLKIDMLDETKHIPPLMFTSLIENAFKYGVSHEKETTIDIAMSSNTEFLYFKQSNTIGYIPEQGSIYSGIGLDNTKRRLDILYSTRYSLDIQSENEIFKVELKIPL